MSRLRTDATQLRNDAAELRSRAQALVTKAAAVHWKSSAADAFHHRVQSTASDLGRRAQFLDDAAADLDRHAASVDEKKAEIAAAAAWVESRWNAAVTLVHTVTSTVETVAHSAVTGFMTLVGHITGADGTQQAQVQVYRAGGSDVDPNEVDRSRAIASAVPTVPPTGSQDWLDLRDLFTSRGWS